MLFLFLFFFFNDTATTEIYTLSLHDALPISPPRRPACRARSRTASRSRATRRPWRRWTHAASRRRRSPSSFPEKRGRSEEHTSELQSPCNLVCRLLLEKKKTHSDLCTT